MDRFRSIESEDMMPSSKPIRDAIKVIEAEASRQNEMETLCGSIVATIAVNAKRGAFDGMQHRAEWLAMFDGWQKKFSELRAVTDG